MAVKPSVVGVGSLDQAAGDNPALRAILQQLTTAANAQATKTSTSGKLPPNQSTATLSFQNPLYIVTITDPGGDVTLSLAQQAQQAASTTLGSNPTLSAIFHQVQAATSILFDVPSGLTTYGGDMGNPQNQFIIGGLDTRKSWYFRFRTSYDGVRWNTWKVINPRATSVNVNAVVVEPVAGGQWAQITLPGGQGIGFGIGQLPSGSSIQTAEGVLLANTIGICGPATWVGGPQPIAGVTVDTINSLGVVRVTYGAYDGSHWDGNGNFLTFGWVANEGQNLAEVVLGDGGRWVILTLAGGSRIAIGVGNCNTGTTIDYPTGFLATNSMGCVTPLFVNGLGGFAFGIAQADIVAGLVTCFYTGTSGTSPTTANWFAIAWEPSLNSSIVTVAGGKYLKLPTPSGFVMVGVGQTHSGGILPIPAGYSYSKCLAFSSPATHDSTSQRMHGVLDCHIDTGTLSSDGAVTCLYGDGGPAWGGNATWFAVCWP